MAEPKGYLVVPLGFRSDGTIRALELDDSDNLKINLAATDASLVIDGASPSLLRPIAKSGRYENLALAAGSYFESAVEVPAGETWRLTGLSIYYSGTVTSVILFHSIYDGASLMSFSRISPVVSGVFYFVTTNILIPAGWQIGAYITNATLNNDFICSYFAEQVY